MPVKKRVPKDRNFQITPEAVELFRKVTEIMASGKADAWEDDSPPGRRRELSNASLELHKALGRKIWQEHVEYAVGDSPGWNTSDDQLADYREAAALRLALVKATRD